MIKFFNIVIVALILSFAFDANADETASTICRIVGYTHSIGGPMITIVIIGAALLSIFGRMPWPALFALGAFTAVFFGAPKIITVIAPGAGNCEGSNAVVGTGGCPTGKTFKMAADGKSGKCE